MKRVMRGTVLLAVAVGFLGCKGDPTSSLRNGIVKLVATPSVVFVNQGANKSVIVEAVDAQGNRLATDFALGTVGAGITVALDTTFNPIFSGDTTLSPDPQTTRVQFIVTPATNVKTSFTVAAGGQTLVIPVSVVPDTLPVNQPVGTVALASPALGVEDTLFAPFPFRFTATSTISLSSGAAAVITGIAADSSFLTFLPGPGAAGDTVNAAGLVLSYAPTAAPYNLTSAASTLTTPAVTAVTGTFSTASPNRGDTVTFTATAPFKILPTASVAFGGIAAVTIAVAPDSSSISFVPVPGSTTGAADVTGTVLDFLTSVPLTLPTTTNLTVPAPYPGTAAPATGPTLTAPATGSSTLIVDGGAFTGADITGDGGVAAKYYKITTGAAGAATFSVTWDNGSDIDLIICGDVACATSPGASAGSSNPETASITSLPAGTYYVAVVLFAGADPGSVQLTITR